MRALLVALALLVCAPAAGAAPTTRWVPVRTPGIDTLARPPVRAAQLTVGRVKLVHVARVSATTVRGKRVTGDLLVVTGEYWNTIASPSGWREGLAFYLGVSPALCTQSACPTGTPAGSWYTFTPFLRPLVDYPRQENILGGHIVRFRFVIQLNPGGSAPNDAIHDLGDLWLLPIFNVHSEVLPFEQPQVIRLSDYFGQTPIPTR
jgi:hypothetical protein